MKQPKPRRMALASITALFGCVAIAACSGSAAFIDEPLDSGSLPDDPPPSPTGTTTSTATATGTTTPPPPPVDAGSDAQPDAGFEDSGFEDSGFEDSGVEDSGVEDSGVKDSGIEDSGIKDTGAPIDSGSTTCLDPTPIDQTTFRYAKAVAPVKGACTTKDLSVFTAYYKAHASDDDFSMKKWGNVVDDTCAACIFTDETKFSAKSWRSIVIDDDELDHVNRGGCIEIVSGSFTCGRAYEQFQECTLQACTSKCTTQQDFNACRLDATVLTTACKNAFAAVQNLCGDKISQYETSCKGTAYTFEGPIRVSCVTGWPLTKDAGPSDASSITDAGDAADAP